MTAAAPTACPRCKRPARGSRLACVDGELARVPVLLELGADGHCASCHGALEVLAMLERHGIGGSDLERAREHLAPDGRGGCRGYEEHASYPSRYDPARLNTWPEPVLARAVSPAFAARCAAWAARWNPDRAIAVLPPPAPPTTAPPAPVAPPPLPLFRRKETA